MEEKKQIRYCIGDMHGNYKALKQVLKRSKFDYEKDLLIVLGDVVDGFSDAFLCVEELLKIKNMVFVIGNHDVWFMNHMKTGWVEEIWIQQGGANTLRSYGAKVSDEHLITQDSIIDMKGKIILQTHKDFFDNGKLYYELDNMLFVHGGFNYPTLPKDETIENLTWDRELLNRVKNGLKITEWKKVFLGHTAVGNLEHEPVIIDNGDGSAKVIQMDCGAGWIGKLCMMNIDTDEYFLSNKFEGGHNEN